MRRWASIPILVALVAAAVAISSCKSGIGEHCQIDSDCETNVCNKANHICDELGAGSDIDALPPIDNPILDAADAAVDMPADQ
jgi:hypothetical protein